MNTTFSYDHYYLYDELTSHCTYFQDTYPQLVTLESLGTTVDQHEIWAMTITNKNSGDALCKPAFYIDANTHAGEVTGCMAAMHTMDYLLTNYGKDASVTKMIDNMTIYIIPRITPDGAETYLSTPYSLRSVNRAYNLKNGGLAQEDLDQDGVIRMMRVKNPHGAWKCGSRHSLVMEKRLPDDVEGEFYNVYIEGIIEDYDGLNVNVRKPLWGLDFNRNYPFGWFSDYRQPGAGKYPLSNQENKAVVDFVLAHPNIGAVATHHTSGGVILYPPGTKPEAKAFAEDMNFYREIGKMGKAETGYDTINIFDHFMIDQENYSSGAFDDWCYQNQGILAYTIELWDLANRAGKPIDYDARKQHGYEEELDTFLAELNWCAKYCPEEISDWHEVDHPQLGKVEIGGVNFKFTHQNPPTSFLLQECEKITRFSLRYAKALPALAVESVTSKQVAEGVYLVEALVANNGYLPTNISQEAKKLQVAQPVMVSIDGAEVVMGATTQDIGDLAGYGQIKTGVRYAQGISTSNSKPIVKKVSWMVKAEAGTAVTVSAAQEKSGTANATIIL